MTRTRHLKLADANSLVVSAPQCDVALIPSQKKKVSNRATVRADVSPSGEVQGIKVTRSTGSDQTDEQILECLRHWRFKASERGMQLTTTVVVDY
jgi:TonB family protein